MPENLQLLILMYLYKMYKYLYKMNSFLVSHKIKIQAFPKA